MIAGQSQGNAESSMLLHGKPSLTVAILTGGEEAMPCELLLGLAVPRLMQSHLRNLLCPIP